MTTLEDDLRGRRDRAWLLVGFAGALRRCELAGLNVSDLEHSAKGLLMTIRQGHLDDSASSRGVVAGDPVSERDS